MTSALTVVMRDLTDDVLIAEDCVKCTISCINVAAHEGSKEVVWLCNTAPERGGDSYREILNTCSKRVQPAQ